MAFLRYREIMNGDTIEYCPVYSCDITGEEILDEWGWCGNDNIHISDNGIEIILEQWLERYEGKYNIPLILEYLEGRFTERIKPDRYISKELRKTVLEKYKHTCVFCGATEKLEIDHIKPVSKKGLSELKNLQVLCKPCNIKKSNKLTING